MGYDVWDIGTGNLVYYCDTEEEALAFVRTAIAVNGRRSVSRWALERIENDGDDIEVVAQGAALAKRALQSVPA